MITLEKIAGYQDEANLYDKVAEAMDFMEENYIDPIGGLTALMNVDAYGEPADEKVASELSKLAEEQIDALNQVAEYLGDENPEDIAKVALDIQDNAIVIEKVAEAMDYLDANGIDPESALIIAANVTPEGQFADEKVANEVAFAGFTDEDFTKIAEAIDFLAENEIDLEEAYGAMALLKEAGIREGVEEAGRVIRDKAGKAGKAIKDAAKTYRDALFAKGRADVKARLKQPGMDKDPILKKRLSEINTRQAKAIAGTAAGVGAIGGAAYLATRKKRK